MASHPILEVRERRWGREGEGEGTLFDPEVDLGKRNRFCA